MAPPACLDQIRDPVSQSVVVARCLDNKKDLDIKEMPFAANPGCQNVLQLAKKNQGAWNRILVCCVNHLR